MKRKFEAGSRFTKLLVLERNGYKSICLCDCGNKTEVTNSNLLRGATKSCGCLNLSRDHGLCQTLTYSSWRSMCKRCSQSNRKYYYQKGITVCDRWRNSFLLFLADMGERPTKGHTIDRIDPNGNYEPSNCRWATKLEQAQSSNLHYITFKDKTQSVSAWAREVNLPVQTLFRRIYSDWPIEKALFQPLRQEIHNT